MTGVDCARPIEYIELGRDLKLPIWPGRGGNVGTNETLVFWECIPLSIDSGLRRSAIVSGIFKGGPSGK